MNSMMLPLLEAVEGAATWCTTGLGHGASAGGTFVCQGYTIQRVAVMQSLMVEPQ